MIGNAHDEVGFVRGWTLRTTGQHSVQAVARLADLSANLIEQSCIVVEDGATDVAPIPDVERICEQQGAHNGDEDEGRDQDPGDSAAASNETNYTHRALVSLVSISKNRLSFPGANSVRWLPGPQRAPGHCREER